MLQNSERFIFKVSQLTTKIKGTLEFEIGSVWIQGEVSGFRPSSTGHLYFSLKDEASVISCAMFKSSIPKNLKIEDGMEVIVFGKISVYAPRGSYQIVVQSIEQVGHGLLLKSFEALKKKLLQEGLFDDSRKRKLPLYPERIVVITSPTGAALQDILNVLSRRHSGLTIRIIPSLVQGDHAAKKLIQALKIANDFYLGDVILLARGGGSMEDLWCFNDEGLARAIAMSQIPVISAVGHEVDFTLCDFVADLRAPTPSAAAELVVQAKENIVDQLKAHQDRLRFALSRKISMLRNQALQFQQRMISPQQKMANQQRLMSEMKWRMDRLMTERLPVHYQQIDEFYLRSKNLIESIFYQKKKQHELFCFQLDALSPLKVLGRGYTLIEDDQKKEFLKSVRNIHAEQQIWVHFHDGKAKAKII